MKSAIIIGLVDFKASCANTQKPDTVSELVVESDAIRAQEALEADFTIISQESISADDKLFHVYLYLGLSRQ